MKTEIRISGKPCASGPCCGRSRAVIASLVETCKLNAVDPQRYLAETLAHLVNGWSQSRINDLMPWRTVNEHTA